MEREHKKVSSGEIDDATGAKRPKTTQKKPKVKKYINRNGEIVEEEEPSDEYEETKKYDKGKIKPKTVDKKRKPGKYDEEIEEYKRPKKTKKVRSIYIIIKY